MRSRRASADLPAWRATPASLEHKQQRDWDHHTGLANLKYTYTTVYPTAAKPPSKAETAEDNFINTINLGQLHGRQATLTSEGCGGAYLLQDKHGTRVGVWKPRNQEPFAPANPRGYVDASIRCGCRSPMRPSFRVGWGFLRERAVYTLDQASALQAGVPLTVSPAKRLISVSDDCLSARSSK